jgi:hypothetical protein
MTLRALERTALAGLLTGVGLLVVDAIQHDPANFFRYIPRFRPGRGAWWHLQWLWHTRPALLLGFCILCMALVLALIVVVAGLVRGLGESEHPGAESESALTGEHADTAAR